MNKRMMAVYALVGALAASPVLTSCVDDEVPESVTELRNHQLEKMKADLQKQLQDNENLAIMNKLALEAEQLNNQMAKAQLALAQSNNDLAIARAEYEKALLDKKNETILAELELRLQNANAAAEAARLQAQATRLQAEKELAQAEMDLKMAVLNAQKQLMQKQDEYNKYMADLDARQRAEINKLQERVNAIMQGGGFQSEGGDYESFNPSNAFGLKYNSIIRLNELIAEKDMDLIRLNNQLVNIDQWVAEQVEKIEAQIAVQKALIEKYQALVGTDNQEAVDKHNQELDATISILREQKKDLLNTHLMAKQKVADAKAALESQDIVQKHRNTWSFKNYITEIAGEAEKVEYAYTNAGNVKTELAPLTLKKGIEVTEANKKAMADDMKRNEDQIVDFQRRIAISQKQLADSEKQLADKLADATYKENLKAKQDAVAAAKKAFDEKATQENKDALVAAEAALKAFNDAETVGIENAIFNAKADISWWNERIARTQNNIKDLQTLQALASPENVKAFNEMIAQYNELLKAEKLADMKVQENESNTSYYNGLRLNNSTDFASMIAQCNKNIKQLQDDIAEIAGTSGKMNQEQAIERTKAEKQAYEAELKIRQAQYEAALAELTAKIDALSKENAK